MAQNPDLVDEAELKTLFADPANLTVSEVEALAAADLKTADGKKPMYNGMYNSITLFGEKLNHAKSFRRLADDERAIAAKAPTVLTDPKVRAEFDRHGNLHTEGVVRGIRAREQDIEDGLVTKVNDKLKPWGFEAPRKLIPGTTINSIDWIELYRHLRAKGGEMKDVAVLVQAARSHRVETTKENNGKGHDGLRRDLQSSFSSMGSPEDGC